MYRAMKEILENNLSKTFNSICEWIKRSMEKPEADLSFDSLFFEENIRFHQMISGHCTEKILVDSGAISSEDLREALRRNKILKENGREKTLGVLLVEMGYIT